MAQHACKWRRSIVERPWQIYYKNSPWKKKSKPPKAAEWRADKVWIKTCEECGYTAEVTGIPISSRRAGILDPDHDPLAVVKGEERIDERLTMEIVLRELVRVSKGSDEEIPAEPDPDMRPEPLGSAANSRLVNLTIKAGSDILVLAYVIETLLRNGLIQVEAKNVSKDEIDLQTSRVYLEAHAYKPLAAYFKKLDQDEPRQEALGSFPHISIPDLLCQRKETGRKILHAARNYIQSLMRYCASSIIACGRVSPPGFFTLRQARSLPAWKTGDDILPFCGS